MEAATDRGAAQSQSFGSGAPRRRGAEISAITPQASQTTSMRSGGRRLIGIRRSRASNEGSAMTGARPAPRLPPSTAKEGDR